MSIENNGFAHAGAWYELAELILFGLIRAGFDCTTSINRFIKRRTNIVFGTHYVTTEMEPFIPKDTLFFNTEQLPVMSENFCHQAYMRIRYWAQKGYRFLDYSTDNVEILKNWGASEVIHMPLGYVPELDRLQHLRPEYDCLFYGGLNKRRHELLYKIQEQGLNLQFLNGVYGEDRDSFIERSKVVLNLHLYESEIFELVRVNYLMHNKVCVLTELNQSTKIEPVLRELFICSPRETFVSTALDLTDQPSLIKQKGSEAYTWLRDRPQERIMKSILID